MKSSFSPEYARYLGFKDGREFGTKDPMRSFKRDENDPHGRNKAYFDGLDLAVKESRELGLETDCKVCWDNPTIDHDHPCGERGTHLAIWEIEYPDGSKGHTHVLFVCDKHARMARGLPERHWYVAPISWF